MSRQRPHPPPAPAPVAGSPSASLPALHDLALPLTADLLRAIPPPRRFLVRDDDGRGVIPRNRVGILAAAGGSGKSWMVIQLAVAVATGGKWFGIWPTEQGRVLLILGEEDAEEAMRRLHYAARLCSDDEVTAIAANVTVIPAAGVALALTVETESFGALPETPRATELRALLAAAAGAGRPYVLVILDPSSRFAGADVEKDNAAATRYVQVLETLTTTEMGSPNVLLPAHTRKRGRDDETGSSDLLRGSSGVRDGVRWLGVLDQRRLVSGAPELLDFNATSKVNLSQRRPDLVLCRPEDGGGVLRAATDEEIEAYATAASPKPNGPSAEERAAMLASHITETLKVAPQSTRQLAAKLHVSQTTVRKACHSLADEGAIRQDGGGHASRWVLLNASHPNASERIPDGERTASDCIPPKGGNADALRSVHSGTHVGVPPTHDPQEAA